MGDEYILPPPLPVSIQSSLAIDLDVLTAPLPEHNCILERVGICNALPVRSVIGELDLPVKMNVHIIEECQVQRL